jgi:hypothetical protein
VSNPTVKHHGLSVAPWMSEDYAKATSGLKAEARAYWKTQMSIDAMTANLDHPHPTWPQSWEAAVNPIPLHSSQRELLKELEESRTEYLHAISRLFLTQKIDENQIQEQNISATGHFAQGLCTAINFKGQDYLLTHPMYKAQMERERDAVMRL